MTTKEQWDGIVEAAKSNQHKKVLDLHTETGAAVPSNIFYHKNCRSNFLLKAARTKSSNNKEVTNTDIQDVVRKSKRASTCSNNILMPKTCIFCTTLHKKRKDNTKEYTIKCTDYAVPKKIEDAQNEKKSEQVADILANYDLLANEAHFHLSCYKRFTKLKSSTKPAEENQTEVKTNDVVEQLYKYVCTEIIEKKKVELMSVLIKVYCSLLADTGLDGKITKSVKKKNT